MAKDGRGGNKKRKLTAIIILAVIVLLAAGIILGITYWPANGNEITKSFDRVLDSSLNLTKEDGDYQTVKSFIDTNLPYMIHEAEEDASITDKKDNYVYEMKSFNNIMVSVSKVSYYIDLTFDSSVKGKFVKKDVRAVQSFLNDSSVSLGAMAKFISKHRDETTNFTVILSVWEGIRDYYINLLNDYTETFNILDKVYTNQNNNGIYGNPAATLSIKATKTYLNVMYKNLFSNDKEADSKIGYDASELFLVFANIFNLSTSKVILNYYISPICQKNCAAISDLEKMTDNKVNFEYLIEHNFNVSKLSLTTKQLGYVNPAVALLKAEDLVGHDYTEEVA